MITTCHDRLSIQNMGFAQSEGEVACRGLVAFNCWGKPTKYFKGSLKEGNEEHSDECTRPREFGALIRLASVLKNAIPTRIVSGIDFDELPLQIPRWIDSPLLYRTQVN